jgi:subtilisin family serine protease
LIDDAATSNRYPFVWSTTTGAGTKIAVHEDDGVDNANPFLNNPTHGLLYWSDTVGLPRNIDGHATNIAGIIASTHNWRRGGAFGISEILSANWGILPNAANWASWAINKGADTINMSWAVCSDGSQNFYSHWVDYLVTTNLFPQEGIVLWIGSSYAEALFLP